MALSPTLRDRPTSLKKEPGLGTRPSGSNKRIEGKEKNIFKKIHGQCLICHWLSPKSHGRRETRQTQIASIAGALFICGDGCCCCCCGGGAAEVDASAKGHTTDAIDWPSNESSAVNKAADRCASRVNGGSDDNDVGLLAGHVCRHLADVGHLWTFIFGRLQLVEEYNARGIDVGSQRVTVRSSCALKRIRWLIITTATATFIDLYTATHIPMAAPEPTVQQAGAPCCEPAEPPGGHLIHRIVVCCEGGTKGGEWHQSIRDEDTPRAVQTTLGRRMEADGSAGMWKARKRSR